MSGPALVLTSLVGLALAASIGWILVRRLSGGGPGARPAYRGADPTEVEPRLRQLLWAARESRGLPALALDDDLVELARHHAHWMSVSHRCDEVDDRGRDVGDRLRELFGGRADDVIQEQWCLDGAPADPDVASRRLAEAVDHGALWSVTARRGGVGVAAGGGRLWACLVVGDPRR